MLSIWTPKFIFMFWYVSKSFGLLGLIFVQLKIQGLSFGWVPAGQARPISKVFYIAKTSPMFVAWGMSVSLPHVYLSPHHSMSGCLPTVYLLSQASGGAETNPSPLFNGCQVVVCISQGNPQTTSNILGVITMFLPPGHYLLFSYCWYLFW